MFHFKSGVKSIASELPAVCNVIVSRSMTCFPAARGTSQRQCRTLGWRYLCLEHQRTFCDRSCRRSELLQKEGEIFRRNMDYGMNPYSTEYVVISVGIHWNDGDNVMKHCRVSQTAFNYICLQNHSLGRSRTFCTVTGKVRLRVLPQLPTRKMLTWQYRNWIYKLSSRPVPIIFLILSSNFNEPVSRIYKK